ncbi:MAG TPA: paraquat-inducible protein A [Burkholderiales bacterium]
MAHPTLIACHECDLVQRPVPVPPRASAKCCRCGAVLYRVPSEQGIQRAVALLFGVLILFGIANVYPILSMDLQGQVTHATILGGVHALWEADMRIMAAVVVFTGFLMPLVQILAMLAVLLPFLLRRRNRYTRVLLRVVSWVTPWSMIEVFMLGVFVSMVKLAHLAHVLPGIAMGAFILLIVFISMAATVIDPHYLWSRLEEME